MKTSIKTQGACALLALLGLFPLSSAFTGCSTIFTPQPPCTCFCDCTNGQRDFCESRTDQAGSQACELDCNKIGTPRIACHDQSVVPPTPPTPPPSPCPAGETLVTYQFCITCTSSPNQESQRPVTACTFDDAQDQADGLAGQFGEDCSAELCTGN